MIYATFCSGRLYIHQSLATFGTDIPLIWDLALSVSVSRINVKWSKIKVVAVLVSFPSPILALFMKEYVYVIFFQSKHSYMILHIFCYLLGQKLRSVGRFYEFSHVFQFCHVFTILKVNILHNVCYYGERSKSLGCFVNFCSFCFMLIPLGFLI